MSYIPYHSNAENWKKLYKVKPINTLTSVQTGSGPSSNIQVISPQQGVIERAKNTMKRRINKTKPVTSKQSTSRGRKKKTSSQTTKKKTRRKTPAKSRVKSKSGKSRSNTVKRLKSNRR